MATNLKWIGEKASKEPDLVFTSLYHHIMDVDNLRACYDSLDARKATGVDGVTKQQYGRDLESNLQELSEQLGRMGYRPGAKRRSYIPKAGSAKGKAYYFRFADDFLACFENRDDAQVFRQRLEDRLEGFGLQVAGEKTRSIEFGRYARERARKRGRRAEAY